MFRKILVPVDLADTELAAAAIETAVSLAKASGGTVRLLNVLPVTPTMLAEYVPADFDAQQRQTADEALAIVAKESGLDAARISTQVRQGGVYHEGSRKRKRCKPIPIRHEFAPSCHATYFLGSNAGHVVRYAKCSVLVVRPPQ